MPWILSIRSAFLDRWASATGNSWEVTISRGEKLGNYNILQKIGAGGMGAVYLAEHPLIGKKVALKVIHRELSDNSEIVTRFFNEAKAVTKIGSEHIVEIHDFGQTQEQEHYFVMEYLSGRTLADELKTRSILGLPESLHIGAQIAKGLSDAHSCGVIHRDLKPDNIMLISRMGDSSFVKILDFGLAKMFLDAGANAVTSQGVVLGTPQYMSPEACESRQDIDHRADIYSLGVLLFQMMTGQVPFTADSMGVVLVKHVTEHPPAPRGLNASITPAVEQVILRCLAKVPDHRFPTMAALRDALLDPDRYLASAPPMVPSAIVPEPIRSLKRSATDKRTIELRQKMPIQAPPDSNAAVLNAYAKTEYGVAFENPAPQGAAVPRAQASTVAAHAQATMYEGAVAPQHILPGPQANAEAYGAEPYQQYDQNIPAPTQNRTMLIESLEEVSPPSPSGSWTRRIAITLSVVVIAIIVLVVGKMQGDEGKTKTALLQNTTEVDAAAGAMDKVAVGDDAGQTTIEDAAAHASVADAASESGAVTVEVDAATQKEETVPVTIETIPAGLMILDQNQAPVGKSPLESELIPGLHSFSFNYLNGIRRRTLRIVKAGSYTIQVGNWRRRPPRDPPRRDNGEFSNDLIDID